jgi:hypothetical protein
LNAFAELPFAVVDVDKAGQIFVAGGDVEMTIAVKIGDHQDTSR